MAANIHFNQKDILQKEFKQKMRGYDPADVDGFLDDIIKDYETFKKENQRLEEENDRFLAKVDELTKQLSVSGQATFQNSQSVTGVTNMDILKRLSSLERHVFGPQFENSSNSSHRL